MRFLLLQRRNLCKLQRELEFNSIQGHVSINNTSVHLSISLSRATAVISKIVSGHQILFSNSSSGENFCRADQ